MTIVNVKQIVSNHFDEKFGKMNSKDLYDQHGVRVIYSKSHKLFKIAAFGLTTETADQNLSNFVTELLTLPINFEIAPVEYHTTKKGTQAYMLTEIVEKPETETVPVETTLNMVEISETEIDNAAIAANDNDNDPTAETETIEIDPTAETETDDPTEYDYLFHCRNYNRKDLGNIHTVSFDFDMLDDITHIVANANGTGGYQLVIERIKPGMAEPEIVMKKYSAKKYALAQFETPTETDDPTAETETVETIE